MKLRIESDGTPGGTRVVDAATGEMLEGVLEVAWEISTTDIYDRTAKVRMVVDEVTAKVTGELVETQRR